MKKIIALALIAVLALTILAGCGSKQVTIESVEDLKGLKIGVQAGTTGAYYAADEVEDAKVSEFKSGMDAALDLKNGTIDCVILDELPAQQIVKQNDDLMILDIELTAEDYAIAVKKGNTELQEAINATLARLEADGTLAMLDEAYISPADGNITIPEMIPAEGEEEIVMGTNAAFQPFEFIDNNEIVGYDVYIANEIAKDLGKKLVIEDMDFNALMNAVSSGVVDFVAAGLTVNEERLENADFSDYYYHTTQVIIVRK